MSNHLTRDQLAVFLKDHRAIRAFEELFKQAHETLPESDNELAEQLNSGPRRPSNLDELHKRLDALEVQNRRQVDIANLVARIEAVEVAVGRTQSLSSIISKLEAIEALIGV